MALPFGSVLGFAIFSDVLSIEDRAEQEDRSFLSRYTVFGIGGTIFIAAVQFINATELLPGDNPLSVFYTAIAGLVVVFALVLLSPMLKFPRTISNSTGWTMLGFVGIQALVAYIRQNDIILIPNEMMFVAYGCWGVGLAVYYFTGARPSGLIGSLTMNFAMVVGGGAIFEAVTREMPAIHQHTWAFVLGAAAVMGFYGTLDYLVFRPRRAKVQIEHRDQK